MSHSDLYPPIIAKFFIAGIHCVILHQYKYDVHIDGTTEHLDNVLEKGSAYR